MIRLMVKDELTYLVSVIGILIFIWLLTAGTAHANNRKPFQKNMVIVETNRAGGYAYRLTYYVDVPIEVFWRFKTDFTSDEIAESRHIRRHTFMGRQGNNVITETQFAGMPHSRFVWKTTVYEGQYRLAFSLIQTNFPGHRFHYGHIQLRPSGKGTEVTQVAFFDFVGASIWVINPWRGGMKSFLNSIADWEQQKITKIAKRYR